MLTRRSFIGGVSAIPFGATAARAGATDYNEFAWTYPGVVEIVSRRQTWKSLFGDQAQTAQYLNRQNVALEVGQAVIIPDQHATLAQISPFPDWVDGLASVQVVVSPRQYAWALYVSGGLVRWGPAICGAEWCRDVGRACRTPTGQFRVTEVAGPKRRSSSYPRIEAAEGRGALMPYYMRLTASGVGLHARYIHGLHESHGCVGLFYDDAKWLNLNYAKQGSVSVLIEPY